MAAPTEMRRALAKSSPHLESLYYSSRMQAANLGPNEADNIIACYPGAVGTTFPGQNEKQIKRVITPTSVRELGSRAEDEVLDVAGGGRWSNSDIVAGVRHTLLSRETENWNVSLIALSSYPKSQASCCQCNAPKCVPLAASGLARYKASTKPALMREPKIIIN